MTAIPKTGHRAATVLKALLNGIYVKVGQYTYLMAFTEHDSMKMDLCTLAHDQHGKEHYLRSHMRLGEFVDLVDSMTEEEFLLVAGHLSMIRENG